MSSADSGDAAAAAPALPEANGGGGGGTAAADDATVADEAPKEPVTVEDFQKAQTALQEKLENEIDSTMLLTAQQQQSRMIEKTQQAIELRKFTQQIEEYQEMAEDIIDTLYDYEEKLELHGVFLEKSAAEAFEDAKCEVVARAKRENADAAPMPANLQKLIQVIEHGGAANVKLGKTAEIATAKSKRLQDKHDQLTELLEEVQNTISVSAAHDPREIIRKNRQLKKQVDDLKALLEETLTGLNSKSDTNLKSLKAKSLKLKKDKNALVRDIKAATEAAASFENHGQEKLEDMENKLAILREFKELSDSDISPSALKVALQQCRNDLLTAAIRIAKQHNAAVKAQRKEEAEMAAGNPEEILLKRRINTLKKQLKAAKKATSGETAMEDIDGDGPADPVKFSTLKKQAALKAKEVKLTQDKLKTAQAKMEAATGAGGAKADELMQAKEELPKLKEDLEKAKAAIPERKQEVEQLIKKMATGGGTLGTAARRLKRAVRDLKGGVKDLQGEARETVASFGPWVQEQLSRVDSLSQERTQIAKKAADNYKKQYTQRKQIYEELVAKQKELGEPIEPMPETDSDSD